ncbi:MAG: type IX secretion system outer membrane channel protein PorV [Bacteroidota bacterium]
MKKIVLALNVTACLASNHIFSQTNAISTQELGGRVNAISSALPFLMICPDSRSGGMGEVGAATSADGNSIHWNAAKIAFSEKKAGASLSVSPWLRQLVPDVYLYYVSGYTKISKTQAVAASLRYFSLGNITFTDILGNTTGQFRPSEFAFDMAFSQKLSETFSAGLAARYVRSNLTGNYSFGPGQANRPGTSVGVDFGLYYQSKKFELSGKNSIASAGLVFSNIGSKVNYNNESNFIPMNLRLGGGLKTIIDDYNSFGIYGDINKLLVPTTPIYLKDSNGNDSINSSTNEKIILAGKNPNVGIATGIIQSFGDAPGGSSEELKEINWSLGVEYWYAKTFAVRAGYFNESKTKGNRKFFTAGIGIKYNVFGLDVAYLIPITQSNPLQNTLRFTLSFDFDALKSSQNKSQM